MTDQEMGDLLYTHLVNGANVLESYKWAFLRYAHNNPEYKTLCKDIAEVFDVASDDARAILQEFLFTN